VIVGLVKTASVPREFKLSRTAISILDPKRVMMKYLKA
jgi:hypothetical protein